MFDEYSNYSNQLRLETQYTAGVDDGVLVFWFHLYEYIPTHKNDCQFVFDNPKVVLPHFGEQMSLSKNHQTTSLLQNPFQVKKK